MIGKFQAQLNWCEKFLKHLDLFEERVYYPNVIESPLSVFREMSYEEIWKYCLSNQYYNFQLKDSSIIQFNILTENNFSYCYYSSPYKALSYKDFLIENDIDFNEVGYDFADEYYLYLSQVPKRDNPLMIRYDYAPDDYNEGLHPASHLHIGYDSDIRIGFKCIMLPQTFFLSLIRQCYPNQWYALITLEPLYKYYESVLCKHIGELESVDGRYIKAKDSYEFYLT